MRAGMTYTTLVTLEAGFPDGAIAWTVLKPDGSSAASGSVTPPAGAVSVVIQVQAQYNTLAAGSLYSPRQLLWNYTSMGVAIDGVVTYALEALIPFGVSCNGVRQILGLSESTVPNDQIDLIGAYGSFQSSVGAAKLTPFVTDESYNSIVIRRAIEAQAAYDLISTLQFRAARSESSGTDSVELNKPDYDLIWGRCDTLILEGIILVNVTADPTKLFGSIFTLGTRPADAITNA